MVDPAQPTNSAAPLPDQPDPVRRSPVPESAAPLSPAAPVRAPAARQLWARQATGPASGSGTLALTSAITQPAGLRLIGLAGTVLLALAGYRVLAVPAWLVGTLLLTGAWLVLGRRLTGVSGRWLVTTGVLWAVPLLASPPLASRDSYAYACQGTLVTHGIDPYQHGVAALPCPWLDQVPTLWWHTPVPYGPLWLALSGGAAAGSTGRLAIAIGLLRLIAVLGVLLIAWAGHRLAGRLGLDPVRTAWLGVLSPLVLLHAVSGAHNDALLAGLVLSALTMAVGPTRGGLRLDPASGTHRTAGAPRSGGSADWIAVGVGVLFALAVAVKVTAVVALPFAVLLLARDRRWWPIIRTAALTAVGLAGGYAVLWGATGFGLGWLSALSGTTKLIQWTALPTGIGMTAGYLLRALGFPQATATALTVTQAVGLVTLAVVCVALWLRARARVDRPQAVLIAAGLALAATVLLAPVAFPWYVLTPLAVLAYVLPNGRAAYRLSLVCAALAFLVLPDGTGLAALTKLPGALLDTVVLIGLVIVVVRRWAAARGRPADRATPRPTAS